MDWHATCDDRCPKCNTSISPTRSEDIVPKIYPKWIVPTFCSDEYCDSYPPYALIEMTPDLYKWIMRALKARKDLEATYIQKFDYTPDWKESETDSPTEADLVGPDDLRIDYSMISVSDDDVRWNSVLKHSNVEFSTERIPLKEIKEVFKVYNCPKKNLPLLLNNLEYEVSKKLLERKLHAL
jgi:hypothetical protein